MCAPVTDKYIKEISNMEKTGVKEFLKRKNVNITVQTYLIDALGAMAFGLFASLLIGSVKAIPMRPDTRIPMKKGCISVAVFTRFPKAAIKAATPGPTN